MCLFRFPTVEVFATIICKHRRRTAQFRFPTVEVFATIRFYRVMTGAWFRFPTVEVFATMKRGGIVYHYGFRFPTVEVFATISPQQPLVFQGVCCFYCVQNSEICSYCSGFFLVFLGPKYSWVILHCLSVTKKNAKDAPSGTFGLMRSITAVACA